MPHYKQSFREYNEQYKTMMNLSIENKTEKDKKNDEQEQGAHQQRDNLLVHKNPSTTRQKKYKHTTEIKPSTIGWFRSFFMPGLPRHTPMFRIVYRTYKKDTWQRGGSALQRFSCCRELRETGEIIFVLAPSIVRTHTHTHSETAFFTRFLTKRRCRSILPCWRTILTQTNLLASIVKTDTSVLARN